MNVPGLERSLPEDAYAAALASLPGVGPVWLARLLADHSPSRAWELVAKGVVGGPRRGPRGRAGPGAAELAGAARRIDVARLWSYCRREAIAVAWLGSPGYPSCLAPAPVPPGVVFSTGLTGGLYELPAVAVVGTRRCSAEGASVAWQLGYDLASAGVLVVSGLALGIDGAVHAGALAAVTDATREARSGVGSTLGVAASGVDVVYPRQHAGLWGELRRCGAVISETPPGMPAQAWRFPSRNRVIAALASMVVVVESHATGGSWHTVEAALRMGKEVGAVPGPVRSAASAGTNTMLHEGAVPVRGAQDVLDVLGLAVPEAPRSSPSAASPGGLDPLEQKILDALGGHTACLDEIVEGSGLPLGAAVVVLERLEAGGLLRSEAGWWSRLP